MSFSELWFIQEKRLSDLNVTSLFDNDTATCFEFKGVAAIFTIKRFGLDQGYFDIHVMLPNDLEANRHDIVRVLTLEDADDFTDSCQYPKEFRKCLNKEGFVYSCYCQEECHVYVKITFVSQWVKMRQSLMVCEIRAD